jgi:hypothetical protein
MIVTNWNNVTKFASISFPRSAKFVAFLQSITPTSVRRFNQNTKEWEIYFSKMPLVVSVAKKMFGQVDYRALPGWVQLNVAAGATSDTVPFLEDSVDLAEAYSVLYVTPEAPWEVVKASYRALVSLHHPDHGGSAEKMVELNSAFESIKQGLGK